MVFLSKKPILVNLEAVELLYEACLISFLSESAFLTPWRYPG